MAIIGDDPTSPFRNRNDIAACTPMSIGRVLMGRARRRTARRVRGLGCSLIASSLWDQQIYSFYSPLVAQIPGGCSLTPDEVTTQGISGLQQSGALFTCTSGAMGAIEADSTYVLITLSFYAH
jgi:hypothetical protein